MLLPRYMATSGLDGQMKIWDLRNYKHLNAYYTPTPATSLDISQSGLLGVGFGPRIQVGNMSLCACTKDRKVVASILPDMEGIVFRISEAAVHVPFQP